MSLVKKYRFTTAFKVKIKIVIIISLFYFTKGQVALNKTEYTLYMYLEHIKLSD